MNPPTYSPSSKYLNHSSPATCQFLTTYEQREGLQLAAALFVIDERFSYSCIRNLINMMVSFLLTGERLL